LQLAVGAIADRHPLALAAPVLYGARAADLALRAPPRDAGARRPPPRLASFPRAPDRFVGRVVPMSRASTALAARSGRTGVLFSGAEGIGKTACALELTHQYAELQRFTGFVWFSAPRDDEPALPALGDALQAQLRGRLVELDIAGAARANEAAFSRLLPELRGFLESHSLLIVIDGVERLLRSDGQWRDERLGKLVAAMLASRGESRVVLTSRRRPEIPEPWRDVEAPPAEALVDLELEPLSLRESAILARRSPKLNEMIHGTGGGEDDHRASLASRFLRALQGVPRKLEEAESAGEGFEAWLSRRPDGAVAEAALMPPPARTIEAAGGAASVEPGARSVASMTRGWGFFEEREALLVAFDIVGFSRSLDVPDHLLIARTNLSRAVLNTPLVDRASADGTLRLHFLGDELRIAFGAASVEPREVLDFVAAVLAEVERSGTRVRVVAVSGPIAAWKWAGCEYLRGPLAFKAQRWAGDRETLERVANPSGRTIAVDRRLSEAAPTALGGQSWAKVKFGPDDGWLLKERG
jgi:hypothetical protein